MVAKAVLCSNLMLRLEGPFSESKFKQGGGINSVWNFYCNSQDSGGDVWSDLLGKYYIWIKDTVSDYLIYETEINYKNVAADLLKQALLY